MRRTVRGLQSLAEGFRVLAYRTAMKIDAAENGDTAAHDEAALLTPVVKAFGTEWGFRGASEALQVWGGYGYVREAGIDAIVLELPFQPVCRPDCQGLCPDCGLDLNTVQDHSHDESVDPRWAKLAQFETDAETS